MSIFKLGSHLDSKQGDALSPILFNLELEKVIRSMPIVNATRHVVRPIDDTVIKGSTYAT